MTGDSEEPAGTPTTIEVGIWGGCTKEGAGQLSLALSFETSGNGPYGGKGWCAGGKRGLGGPAGSPGAIGVT